MLPVEFISLAEFMCLPKNGFKIHLADWVNHPVNLFILLSLDLKKRS